MHDLSEADKETLSSSDGDDDDDDDDEDYIPSDEAEHDANNDESEIYSKDVSEKTFPKKRESLSTTTTSKNVSEEDDEEARKRRADALFEAFLADTDEATTSAAASATELRLPKVKQAEKDIVSRCKEKVRSLPNEEDIFGETDERSHEDKKSEEAGDDKEIVNGSHTASIKRPTIGLSSALGLASKKSRMSVLDKSQKDWNEFKEQEGIEEDLTTHNRGRDGYLDKVDFLTRADFRQFINERDARALQRNKKL